jgi:hypothetical protein
VSSLIPCSRQISVTFATASAWWSARRICEVDPEN